MSEEKKAVEQKTAEVPKKKAKSKEQRANSSSTPSMSARCWTSKASPCERGITAPNR